MGITAFGSDACNTAESFDIICQGSLGAQAGMSDPRGVVFFGCKDYIQCQQPAVFILENVSNLVSLHSGEYFKRVVRELTSIKTEPPPVSQRSECKECIQLMELPLL